MRRLGCLFVLLLVVTSAVAQPVKNIRIKNEALRYRPKHFLIASVADERSDSGDIGTIRTGKTKSTKINLEGGAAQSLSSYLNKNLLSNSQSASIRVGITQLEISETFGGGKEQTNLKYGFAFYHNNVRLIDYEGTAYAQSIGDASSYIEMLIRQGIERSLKEFDIWLAANPIDKNSTPVIVEAEISASPNNPDLVAYELNRPVHYDDFAGEVDDMSMAAAVTYSGFNMRYSMETSGGKVKVKVYVLPFFDKTKSWFRDEAKTPEVLAHEQIHFDITASVAQRLIQAIRNYKFTADNYEQELLELQRTYEKEMTRRQRDYDKETKHGTIVDVQVRWEQILKRELKYFSASAPNSFK
jgi:hypothetical protein